MARAAVRLVFAAMLALLSMQAAVPSVRIAAAVETVWVRAEQQAPRVVRRLRKVVRVRPSAPAYQSFVASQPDIVLSFQLPPPAFLFAS
jgi:hypothetical protein